MPVFSFYCKKCDQDFETFLKHDEKAKCIYCKSTRVTDEKNNSYRKGEAKEDAIESMKSNKDSIVVKRDIISDRKTGKQIGLGEPKLVRFKKGK